MNVPSKDLNTLLEISTATGSDLEMSFSIRSRGEQGNGTMYLKLKNPSIKVVYDNVKVFNIGVNEQAEGNNEQEIMVQNMHYRVA